MNVLVVEDDPSQAKTIRTTLESQDWSVDVASNVEEAVHRLGDGGIDAAVVDYHLPDGDGFDVLEACKRDAPEAAVLFLTGSGNEEVALEALSRGAARYLVKGEDMPAGLPEAVRDAVEGWTGVTPLEVVEAEPDLEEPDSGSEGPMTATTAPADGSLADFVESVVEPPVRGLGVYNDKGDKVEGTFPEGLDEEAPGVLAAAATHQMEGLSGVLDLDIEGQVLLARGENGIVGVTVVPGPLIVVLLLEPTVARQEATERLFKTAAQVWERSG
jgi:CheY-like chemotaxis protein